MTEDKLIFERYISIFEQEEVEGTMTPDGESRLGFSRIGTKYWVNKDNQIHRLDGPAVVRKGDGPELWEYWINDVQYPYEEWKELVKAREGLKTLANKRVGLREQEEKTGDVTPDGESTLEIAMHGTKRWFNKRGQFHRRDGPAIETSSGSRQWWVNDKLHRLDGPAVEFADGRKAYYINDIPLSEDEFYAYHVNKAIKKKNKKMIDPFLEKYIQIIENNSESTMEERDDGVIAWRNKKGELHRTDGPALITPDEPLVGIEEGDDYQVEVVFGDMSSFDCFSPGCKGYFINGKLHREDGPAIEYADGVKYWYLNDKQLSEDQFYEYIVNKVIKRKKK